MSADASFVQDATDDPVKAEVWTLSQDGDVVTLGWRKGSRWISLGTGQPGETNVVHLTLAQMRQLGQIAQSL